MIYYLTEGKEVPQTQDGSKTMKAKIQFRVYKLNGSKCIRKFDSLEEAQNWVWVHEDLYRVDWVEPPYVQWGYVVEPERKNSWNNKPYLAY